MVENGMKIRGDLKLLMIFEKKTHQKIRRISGRKNIQSLKIFGLEIFENFRKKSIF